ncbi:hypothetical protein BGZ49_001543 [Haplosporangium sp. Z 27]|nr:hypothetical protein BGZ49_001543 [Haplosporangium sp. Z 27]
MRLNRRSPGKGGELEEEEDNLHEMPMALVESPDVIHTAQPATLSIPTEGQFYHQDGDYAIAHGSRCSAKDGSVYLKMMQQEDSTQGAAILSNERPLMPRNAGALNDMPPTSCRAEQLRNQHLQFQPIKNPNPHWIPSQQQQRKRPRIDEHDQSITPRPANVQQQPESYLSYQNQSTILLSSAQFIIPLPVQPQLSRTTFTPSIPLLQRDFSDSTIVSVDQLSHLFSHPPLPEHHRVATPTNILNLIKESVSKAVSNRQQKLTDADYNDRMGRARIACGGSVSWCHLYKQVRFESLPTKEEFEANPPPPALQRLLDVPIEKSRKNSEVEHFIEKQSMHGTYSHRYKYNNDTDGGCSENDGDNNNNNNNNSNSNSDNNDNNNDNKGNGVNKDRGMNDKTVKNSPERFRRQMVITTATSTEPELLCGKPCFVGNGARLRKTQLDRDNPGVRTAALKFRRLQQIVRDQEPLISQNVDDSNTPICGCGGAKRDQKALNKGDSSAVQ